MEERNSDWQKILDHPYTVLITRGTGSGITKTLLNLVKQENDDDYLISDKIYFYFKEPNETKY